MNDADRLPRKKKLAFSAASLILFIVLFGLLGLIGEALVRLMAPKSDSVKLGGKLENSERLFGLRPNTLAIKSGVSVKTNSLGFRENEYPLARLPGVRRIAVLGDSFTFGVGVEFSETFSKRLEKQLNRAVGPYEVINFGVSGYNTTLELATLRESAAPFRPDLVIVGYVLNDAERFSPTDGWQAGAASPSLLNATHMRLKERSLLYRFLSPKLGAAFGLLFDARYAVGSTNQIMSSFDDDSPGWIESRQALLAIAREVRAFGGETLVVIFPAIIDFDSYPVAAVHETVARFCRENGIDVLDLLPRFRRENAARLAVPLDGHPNSAAHGIFAEEILAYLARAYPALMTPQVGH